MAFNLKRKAPASEEHDRWIEPRLGPDPGSAKSAVFDAGRKTIVDCAHVRVERLGTHPVLFSKVFKEFEDRTGHKYDYRYWAERENFFLRDLLEYCRRVNSQDFTGLLRGTTLPELMTWPPQTKEAAAHLELWMTITANEAITALERGTDWADTRTLLDVGGGDATIACALVRKFEHLEVTVFNLPASAELARERIAREKLESRVKVVEGNFLQDTLPHGFDRVQFSRVLADWDPSVCQMLLEKSQRALKPGGSLVISEPFDDTNRDLAISWEFRYTFYDDFGVQTYKSIAQYQDMLRNAGFSSFKVIDRIDDTLYGVLTAR